MRILGVISDTHGLLRDEAVALLQGVDHIIHAGDIGDPTIIERLETVAPVSAIRGNVDVEPWASKYAETLQATLFGQKIFVVHDLSDLAFGSIHLGTNVLISGHSHRASFETRNEVLYLNPGSAGPRRFGLPITLATVQIARGFLVPEIHEVVEALSRTCA